MDAAKPSNGTGREAPGDEQLRRRAEEAHDDQLTHLYREAARGAAEVRDAE